jgi:hypothetical protein
MPDRKPSIKFYGTPGRIRTYDTLLRTEVLYPLSYRSMTKSIRLVVLAVHNAVVAKVVIVDWLTWEPQLDFFFSFSLGLAGVE